MQNIIRYANGHHDTQLIVLSVSEAGVGVLNDMLKKLHGAGTELQRLEDESGIPLSDGHAANVDAYFTLEDRIQKVLLLAPHMLHRFDHLIRIRPTLDDSLPEYSDHASKDILCIKPFICSP